MVDRLVVSVALALFASGCSLTLDFTDCDSNDDCSGNDRCVEGICEAASSNPADTGADLDMSGDATEADDMGGDTRGDDADVEIDAADMSDSGPQERPVGRTLCPLRPSSGITEPKATVGNGNAASCTFDALLQAIEGGGLITFECGVDPHTITFTERITIQNDVHIDGGGLVTFDGGQTTRLFLIDSGFQSDSPHLVLEDLTLQNGAAMTDEFICGGAVERQGGSLTVIDSTFQNHGCTSIDEPDDPVGGAIGAVDGGPLVIYGSEFSSNSGSGGGAIFVRDTEVEITNTTFTDNEALSLSGGAITGFDQTTLSLCGCTFDGNDARGFGGGLYFSDEEPPYPTVSIAQTTFVGNAGQESGGAADIEGAALQIDSTTFDTNASEWGGALWLGANQFSMINVTFFGNESTNESGGAIYYGDDVDGTVEHATFANNLAGATPGSVVGSTVDAPAAITFRNTVFTDDRVEPATVFCAVEQMDGGGNIQWPDESTPCTPDVEFGDPMLSDLSQNGGQTETALPGGDGAATGAADGCPRYDQRGVVRPEDGCTSGAVQLEE